MKRNLIRFAAALLALLCIMSFAACSKVKPNIDKPAESAAESAPQPESQEEAPESKEEPAPVSQEESQEEDGFNGMGLNANGKFSTIADFVNSDLMKGQMESLKQNAEDGGMSIEVLGEGDKLIYEFTFGDLGDIDLDVMASSLEAALETQTATFVGVANSLKSAVEVEDPVVEVRYLAMDGTVICSREFSANEDASVG